jgi:undecaprenyl-diphosphatase
MGTARGLGFARVPSARFSFLLSAPVVAGAGVKQLGEAALGDEAVEWGPMLVGALVAAVAGLFVIRFLLRFLQSHTLRVFVWYRIAAGAVVLIAAWAGAF